jgi:hypothetical protein
MLDARGGLFLDKVFIFRSSFLVPIILEMNGLGFFFYLDSDALLVPWSPPFHFSLSTSILSTAYESVGGCYHYSKVDLSTLVEFTLLRILT